MTIIYIIIVLDIRTQSEWDTYDKTSQFFFFEQFFVGNLYNGAENL